jgi:hypothetical protein
MSNWKYYLIVFIGIEIIYRLIGFYNRRFEREPIYVTLIKCPDESIHFRCHLGVTPADILAKVSNWYRILRGCRVIDVHCHLSSIIRSVDLVLFLGVLKSLMA